MKSQIQPISPISLEKDPNNKNNEQFQETLSDLYYNSLLKYAIS